MELRHLRYFAAVAESLHFTRAAEKLRVAQPALSQQIRALEGELGVRLLERTNRKVALTHAGSVFLEEARALLAHAEHARARAKQAEHGHVGRLNVGYILSATGRMLTQALRDFQRSAPEVEVTLHDLGEAQQWKQLQDGQLDVAFTRTAIESQAIARRSIESGRMMLLLPPGHPLAARREVRLSACAGEHFIIGRDSDFPSYNHFLHAMCRSAGFELQVRQRVRDLASILWMVSAGMSLGFSFSGLDDLGRGEVVKRPLLPRAQTHVWMQWRKDDTSPVLKRFLSVVPKKSLRLR